MKTDYLQLQEAYDKLVARMLEDILLYGCASICGDVRPRDFHHDELRREHDELMSKRQSLEVSGVGLRRDRDTARRERDELRKENESLKEEMFKLRLISNLDSSVREKFIFTDMRTNGALKEG